MAAGGERKIESNQFVIDVSCFNCSQRYKYKLSATSNLGRRFLPVSVSIYKYMGAGGVPELFGVSPDGGLDSPRWVVFQIFPLSYLIYIVFGHLAL